MVAKVGCFEGEHATPRPRDDVRSSSLIVQKIAVALHANPQWLPRLPRLWRSYAKRPLSIGKDTAKRKSRFCLRKGVQAAGQAAARLGQIRLSDIV